jgi:hypothetical protein
MPAHDHLARKWDYDSASKEERIASLLAMIKPEDYQHMAKVLGDMFGLEYKMVDSHPSNIKAIIKYKTFTFRKGISDASKTFMVLHSLGHYYFISRAKKVGVKRFEYIYDKEGMEGGAIVKQYGELGEGGRPVSRKMRTDRVAFEIGANNYGIEMLEAVGLGQLSRIVKIYEAGDVNYILDVTAGGKAAIVPTDHDYLDRYICNNLSYEEDSNDDGVFDKATFDVVGGLDWNYLDELKLEVHFF